MSKLGTTLVISTFSALCACGASATKAASEPSQELEYRPCPPSLPQGCQLAVLEGNPSQEGPYTMRLKLPEAFLIQPHSHPKSARVTILEGSLNIGNGEEVNKSRGKRYSAGDSYTNPADNPHYAWADGPIILEISGEGPRTMVPIGPGHQD